ncbi:MAG: ABC transporter permease [Vicinamibacteria bacterium]
MRAETRRRVLPAAALVSMFALWELAVALFDIPEYIIPSPLHVARTFTSDFGTIVRNLVPTAIESFLGFVVGNGLSIAVATLFVHQRTIEQALFPLAIILRSIPIVALAPILVLLFGNDLAPKVIIAALVCFFPTLVNMVKGLSSINPQALELMKILSATKGEVFWKLRIYNSLPYLFAALKIAASASVIGAIVGEWIGSTEGIGALIIHATYNFDTGLLYASIAAACIFSVLFTSLISFLERRLVKWSPGEA